MVFKILVGPPMPVPAGIDEHRMPAAADGNEMMPVDGAPGSTRHPHDDAWDIADAPERKLGEIMAILIAVKGHIDIGAGIRHHLDLADLEFGALGIDLARFR